MPESNLVIEETLLDGGVTLLTLSGAVDGQAFEQLDAAVHELMANGACKMVVDLQQLKYLSSAGIGVFMNAMTVLRGKQGNLVLLNPTENVREVFDSLHLTKLFLIADSLEKALSFF